MQCVNLCQLGFDIPGLQAGKRAGKEFSQHGLVGSVKWRERDLE